MEGSFTCLSRDNEEIRWIVDGLASNFHYITETRRITVKNLPYNQEQNLQESRIYIPAITANSHIARIKCRAYILDPFQYSESNETAQFRVQGTVIRCV